MILYPEISNLIPLQTLIHLLPLLLGTPQDMTAPLLMIVHQDLALLIPIVLTLTPTPPLLLLFPIHLLCLLLNYLLLSLLSYPPYDIPYALKRLLLGRPPTMAASMIA